VNAVLARLVPARLTGRPLKAAVAALVLAALAALLIFAGASKLATLDPAAMQDPKRAPTAISLTYERFEPVLPFSEAVFTAGLCVLEILLGLALLLAVRRKAGFLGAAGMLFAMFAIALIYVQQDLKDQRCACLGVKALEFQSLWANVARNAVLVGISFTLEYFWRRRT
jgi:uncharacterized membrane protein